MPEIGPTLRDARMRAKVDIADVELATKIRARYLRAIENEEWAILPGETFARSFIRTYAEYLGLDAKMLLEEFRRRHERPSDLDLTPIAPLGTASSRRGPRPPRGPRRPLGRGILVALSLVGILALLLVIGLVGDDSNQAPSPAQTTTTGAQARNAAVRRRATQAARRRAAARAAAARTSVALELRPSAPVWVCLVDPSGKKLVPGVVLSPGGRRQRFKAKAFTATFGNGSVDLVINGRRVGVPASANPIGYRITPKGARSLAEADRPTCG